MTYRPELTDVPARLQKLKVHRGYPVPWFVPWFDGEPEFRALAPENFVRAIKEKRCWVCGDPLGTFKAFVTGPMCVVNRTNAEPPCHLDCAQWSARFCPFLSRPHAVRREDDEINANDAGWAPILRNPGCAAVFITKSFRPFRVPHEAAALGWLIAMGDPVNVEWYCAGRVATRAEVEASIDSGMPALAAACEREPTPDRCALALRALAAARAAVAVWLPHV